jgi:type II secretory pathway pseudopilin PulG
MKKSFTLIELLISVTISALVLSLLFESIQVSKVSNETYQRAYIKKLEQSSLLTTINQDLLQADKKSIKIYNSKEANMLSFRSKNSYKNYEYPYIYYIFSNKKLLRAESKYQKIDNKNILANDIDIISSIVEFKAYKDKNTSKGHKAVLIYYKNNLKRKYIFRIPVI